MSKKLKFIKLIIIIYELFYYYDIRNKRLLFLKKQNNSKNFNIIRQELLKIINKNLKKNITNIDSLYILKKGRFGNFIISLNNAIIFCEYLFCKKIIIEDFSYFYFKNKINYQKFNLSIESKHNFIYNNNSIIVDNFFFYKLNFTFLGDVNRFLIFRKEILNNLPKVKVNPNDLYIYIRGGDIFKILNKSHPNYAQPPLCFYENILKQFVFREIRIVSEDKLNPIISKLLEKYNYIKYNKYNIKFDISYLSNSYNIVSAKSSFILSIIKLNNNIKFVWEYDLYKFSERYLHLHYSVYKNSFNYIIYKMNVSENYKKLMFPFINSENQRNLMIKEKCNNNFFIISPKIF